MRPARSLVDRLVCWLLARVQGSLPYLDQGRVPLTGLNPEAEQLEAARGCRVVQEAFLTAMTQTAGEPVTANQHFPGLMTQAVCQSKMCTVRSQ